MQSPLHCQSLREAICSHLEQSTNAQQCRCRLAMRALHLAIVYASLQTLYLPYMRRQPQRIAQALINLRPWRVSAGKIQRGDRTTVKRPVQRLQGIQAQALCKISLHLLPLKRSRSLADQQLCKPDPQAKLDPLWKSSLGQQNLRAGSLFGLCKRCCHRSRDPRRIQQATLCLCLKACSHLT